MANQLTDSETKMLWDLLDRHRGESYSMTRYGETLAMAALSELLLAAKEKACKDICTGCRKGFKYQGGSHQYAGIKGDTYFSATWFECKAEAIRNSDWGDLFEGKL